MIIDVLLEELRKTYKKLITASGVSSENTVKHYLKGSIRDIAEIIEATEQELRREQQDEKH